MGVRSPCGQSWAAGTARSGQARRQDLGRGAGEGVPPRGGGRGGGCRRGAGTAQPDAPGVADGVLHPRAGAVHGHGRGPGDAQAGRGAGLGRARGDGGDPVGGGAVQRQDPAGGRGTGALIAAATGAYRTGEKTLARQLLPRLGPGMLLLADANFACYELWAIAAATGADLLWRAGAQLGLPAGEVLADGTYLSRLKAPRHLRRQGAEDITVRVIEYHIQDASGEVTETFTLITTLLDPETAPARELAGLYHARWEIETAIGAVKPEMNGGGIVLRSKTPEGAEQEVWALLCAYPAIRELICAAAALARQGPLRISFVNALDVVRGPVGSPGSFPPSPA